MKDIFDKKVEKVGIIEKVILYFCKIIFNFVSLYGIFFVLL